jgi:hypothetical protein
MDQATQTTSATILARALVAGPRDMSQELASFLASLELDPADSKRADELAAKARCGTLTAVEEGEIEEYRRSGRIIEALKLRALKVLNTSR